ncbi:type II toxin-antitoxin system RelE/ParE family toxin, partial [Pseudomonas aeruginosa]
MAKYRISHDAQADIVDILRFTHNRFGDAARRRYQALIGAALEAVADSTTLGHPARAHLDTRSTRTWTPDPRPLGQAVGAQRRRVAL